MPDGSPAMRRRCSSVAIGSWRLWTLRRQRGRRRSTLLLTGEPGVGKTALLVAATEMAAARGARVIRGGGVEYETDVSFAGLHQLVDPLSEDLRRLPRPVASGDRGGARHRVRPGAGPASVLKAALALFRQAASSSPLLVVIDDMHWLDRASGAVLGFVGRRLARKPDRTAGRHPARGGWVLRARRPVASSTSPPLAEADAMDLLARQFAHLPTRVLREVVDEAQGNPLALLEFAASVGDPHDPAAARQPDSGRAARFGPCSRPGRAPARSDATPAPARCARRLRQPAVSWRRRAGRESRRARAGRARPPHRRRRSGRRDEVPAPDDQVRGGRALHARRAARGAPALAEPVRGPARTAGHHLAEAALAPDEDDRGRGRGRRPPHAPARRRRRRGRPACCAQPTSARTDRDRSRRLADAAYIGAHSAGQLDSSSELLRDAARGDPTLGQTLARCGRHRVPPPQQRRRRETTHHLLTVAIESALDEPDQDRDGTRGGACTRWSWSATTPAGRVLGAVPPGHGPLSGRRAPTEVLLLAETFADPLTASAWALSELDRRDRPAAGHERSTSSSGPRSPASTPTGCRAAGRRCSESSATGAKAVPSARR